MNSLDGNQDKVSPNKALKSILQQETEQNGQTNRQAQGQIKKREGTRGKKKEGRQNAS